MTSKLIKTAIAAGVAIISLSVTPGYATDASVAEEALLKAWERAEGRAALSIPAQPLAAPPGMVPMIVYVPAQQMQPAAVPPHSHAPMPPKAAQTIVGTHCSINDVAVLTKDAPSCQKAGGKVVAERTRFKFSIGCTKENWQKCQL